MPSPIAHGLGGMIAGWIVDPPPRGQWPATLTRAALFGAAGAAPDLDLLVGTHRGPTHGLGAAVIAGVAAWIILWGIGSRGKTRMAGAIAVAYASHTLLDWLGVDPSPPSGIMALWPFSHDYFVSGLNVFTAVSRQYWRPEFWTVNLRALAGELAILLPLAALVFFARRRPA